MAVRAKLHCSNVNENHDGSKSIAMYAVSDDVNDAWRVATPAASLTMTINNEAAAGQFEAGKDYFLDITEADA